MLECGACGAEGEDNFSKNDLGDLVCHLCGTQSFLQNRNETQELDDMGGGGGMTGLSQLRIRKKRFKKKDYSAAASAPKLKLVELLRAVQLILQAQGQALIDNCNCAPIVQDHIQTLWISFLKCWAARSSRDIMDCFTHLVDHRKSNERLERRPERTEFGTHCRKPRSPDDFFEFKYFTFNHLISICYLACRKACNGVIPSDIVHWVQQGKIPYYSVYSTLPEALQEHIGDFHIFFTKNNLPGVFKVTAFAEYLVYNMDLKLPPLNVPLVAYRLIRMFDMPPLTYDYFLRLAGYQQPKLGAIKPESVNIGTQIGVVCYLICAIRCTPSWQFWIHTRNPDVCVLPWVKEDLVRFPRQHLETYVAFCHNEVFYKDDAPPQMLDHINELEKLASFRKAPAQSDVALNPVEKFWPGYASDGTMLHADGLPESYPDNVSFYPIYDMNSSTGFHGYHTALENIVLLLGKHIDAHPSLIMKHVSQMDRDLFGRNYSALALTAAISDAKLKKMPYKPRKRR